MTEETEKTGKNWRGYRRGWWFLIPIFVAAGVVVFGGAVMYLWNAIIPAVFTTVGTITFCQAIGILILSKILFGGFRGGRRGCGCGWGGRGRGWHWRDKWSNMSEEEKAKLREEWKNRCGGSC